MANFPLSARTLQANHPTMVVFDKNNKTANVEEVRREFKAAWKNAGVRLEIEDL